MDTKLLLKALMEDEYIEVPTDILLDLYIEDAKSSIKEYSMLTEEEYNNKHLEIQTVKLAKYRYINRKYLGIKNSSEGNKRRSFEYGSIPQEIKISLPNPPVFSA